MFITEVMVKDVVSLDHIARAVFSSSLFTYLGGDRILERPLNVKPSGPTPPLTMTLIL